ncbi:MAG: ABC transporter ATP-binding protein [Actinomycetota bacterium]
MSDRNETDDDTDRLDRHEDQPVSDARRGFEDDTVLELRQVVKDYPTDPPTRVLRGIDLSVKSGELVAIVGPSGSGKSTLMNIIGTLDRPTSGSVRVAGHEVSDLSDSQLSALRGHEIGFVFQQFFLLSGLTAVENVADGLLYRGLPRKQRQERAIEALERVGLGHRLNHQPQKLSGGERQRVAIARALVGRPSVVLADEPTGNLDSVSSASIMSLLNDLNAEGATILVITHDRELASRLPRQVAVRDGEIEHDSAATGAMNSAETGTAGTGTSPRQYFDPPTEPLQSSGVQLSRNSLNPGKGGHR